MCLGFQLVIWGQVIEDQLGMSYMMDAMLSYLISNTILSSCTLQQCF